MTEPFVCSECEEPKPLFKSGVCKECWQSWQEYMDHVAGEFEETK